MRFDDRLLTVLNQPVGDRHDRAVRWRQLVELVARAGRSATSPIVADAIEAIRQACADVDEPVRAAAARAIAPLPLPFDLVLQFATDRLTVSTPVLAAATLSSQEWRALHEQADVETRRFIETLQPELKSEPPQLSPLATPVDEIASTIKRQVQPRPEAIGETASFITRSAERPVPEQVDTAELQQQLRGSSDKSDAYVPPSLAELVGRIERRQHKQRRQPAQPPVSKEIALFRWECNPAGDIRWVEGAPRGALIGRSLAQPQSGEGHGVDPQLNRAFALRTPFRDERMSFFEGSPLAGDWKVSGVPAFEMADGRFAGYRGIAYREAQKPRAAVIDLAGDPDSLRELVHELRTPLNAIIGFAEIIDTQLLGPADEAYRARAAEIVGQARLLLNAISDLDFVGEVHAAAARGEKPSADLGAVLERLTPSLQKIGDEHNVPMDEVRAVQDLTAAVEPNLAERLIFRLWSSLVRQAQPGEHLRLTVDQRPDSVAVVINRPASMADADEQDLFGEGVDAVQSLELRLLRGLAAVAGGDLTAPPGVLSLVFPRR